MKFNLQVLLLLCSSGIQAQVSGFILDNYSQPVPNAKVSFINEQNPAIKYDATADASGYYNLILTSGETLNSSTTLFQASPNPFYYNTTLSFYLENNTRIKLSVYNLKGQQIRILESASLPAGNYQYDWDGCLQNGVRANPGMYILALEAGGKYFKQKVILIPSQELAAVGVFHQLKSLSAASYQVLVTGEDADTLLLRNVVIPENNRLDFSLYRRPLVPFATVTDYLGIWNGTGHDQIFIKGINLGVSVPGTLPGELAATRDQYSRWIKMIGEAGFNAIRLYTLHYPRFYQELALYNNTHPEKPIYLFQGIWLQEDTMNGNLYHYSEGFDHGIEEVIDCIHGRKTIPERYGRAYGKFDADVSRWAIGFIIGREIDPDEIEITDFLNSGKNNFTGTALKLLSGSPTETWLAERLDKLITYEKNNYKTQRPVSVSSWPTLDPLDHPSEPDDLTDEDKFSFDLQKIDMFNAPGGYFASYHAYPYYPDFINRDAAYLDDQDDEGPNSYLGYLRDLKKHYAGRPLIIAEYGIPSSWGIAHTANSGMNHGGVTEVQQGEMDVRLLKNISTAGCGGGMLFSWIDEWFKRTWLFDPIRSEPKARMALWQSIASAEENFGMIAFDLAPPAFQQYQITGSQTAITAAKAAADAQFFHLKLTLQAPLQAGDSVWIGLDTYNASLGELILPNGATTSKRSEFALLLKTDSAKLYVTEAYDLFGIWFIRNNNDYPEKLYHSIATNGSPWHLLRLKNNFEDSAYQNTGYLKMRKPAETTTSLDAVWFNGNDIHVRIPWHYLQFTDPSARLVMDDDRSTVDRETTLSDGIALSLSFKKESSTTNRFIWNKWEQAPVVTERVKPALAKVTAGNQEISDTPATGKKKKGRRK